MPEYRDNSLQDLGKQVRQKREEQGLSLKDVYEGTKIRIQFLEGIERGDFSEFPGTVYIRGFIRTYLQFIEMDPLWQEYLAALSGGVAHTVREEEEYEPDVVGKCAPPARGFKASSPFWIFVILLLIAAGSSWYVWYTWDLNGAPSFTVAESTNSQRNAATEEPDKKPAPGHERVQPQPLQNPENGASENNPETPPPGVAAPLALAAASPAEGIKPLPTAAELVGLPEQKTPPAAEEAKKDKELVITADGDCWIRVRQGAKTIYERTVKAGDKVSFTVQSRIEVTYGRSGSVKTRWNGKDLGSPGATKGVEKVFYAPDGSTGTLPK